MRYWRIWKISEFLRKADERGPTSLIKNMRRILIFSTNYFPRVGGAEVAVMEITDRIAPADISFDMVTARISRDCPRSERIGNVMVYRVGFGTRFDTFLLPVLGAIKARGLHRKHQYDAFWAIMASQGGIAAVIAKALCGKPKLVLTLQEGDEEEHLMRYVGGSGILYRIFIRPWHILPMRKADIVTAISNYLIERAVKNGVPPRKITLVPNGVDVGQFAVKISKDKVRETRNALGVDEGEKIIITTSRLVKKNAIGDLIDALKYLPENVKLIIAGVGPEEETLKAKAHKFRGRVKFLGTVRHKELPPYLQVADVFVRPSISEGMGNSFIEAMAAGVPVVGTPVGGIPDFLIHEETGLFCAARDPRSIAEQVVRALEDEPLRKKIVANAQKMVAEHYDWNTIAQQMKKQIAGY